MNHIDELELHEYLDGEIAAPRRAEIEHHLDDCAHCRAQVVELRSLFATLDSLPETPLQRDLSATVVATIQPRLVESRAESSALVWWLIIGQLLMAAIAIPFAWRFLARSLPRLLTLAIGAQWNQWWPQQIGNWQQAFASLTNQLDLLREIAIQPQLPNLSLLTWGTLIIVAALLWVGGIRWAVESRRSD